MIRSVMVLNTQGKPRLAKFYDFKPVDKQQELIRSVFGVLCSRADNVSNFVNVESIFGPDIRLVYKHYATLYFVFVFDSSENELAMLDLIQVFVETLDKCFKNVCELDIVYNYSKMHTVLDEIIFGGQVLETNSTEVLKAVEEISKYCFSHPMCGWIFSLQVDVYVGVYLCPGERANMSACNDRLHTCLMQVGSSLKYNCTCLQVSFKLAKSVARYFIINQKKKKRKKCVLHLLNGFHFMG